MTAERSNSGAVPAAAANSHRGALLFVTLSLSLGGTERHLAEIAPRLAALGWRVTIYCLGRRDVQGEAVAARGVEIVEPWLPFQPGSGGLARKLPRLALSAVRLAGLMACRRPSLVHFFLPLAYLVGAPVAIMLRLPRRLVSRRSLNVYQRGWPFARRVEPRLHARMTRVLGNSQRILEQLAAEEGVPKEKLALIYNGVDPARFAPASDKAARRRALGLPEKAFVVVIVANLIRYKGHADLIDGLAKVADRLPLPWTLLAVGRDEGIGAGLAERARALGIGDSLRFLGAREDVPEILSAADCAVLCSHQEGFSNAIVEAMLSGLPLVVTDVGGNAEAVIDGECGFVVPAHAPDRLGEALLAIAGDLPRAMAMGEAARRRAKAHFTIDACVARYDALYRSLLAENG